RAQTQLSDAVAKVVRAALVAAPPDHLPHHTRSQARVALQRLLDEAEKWIQHRGPRGRSCNDPGFSQDSGHRAVVDCEVAGDRVELPPLDFAEPADLGGQLWRDHRPRSLNGAA